MMRNIKNIGKQICYFLMLYALVMFAPPTAYAVAFCGGGGWEAFATMWISATELWVNIVFFGILLLLVIVGVLILLFKIAECEGDE
jgi:hypothetical protein